jgi:potassium-dependent mechanosensitive channel
VITLARCWVLSLLFVLSIFSLNAYAVTKFDVDASRAQLEEIKTGIKQRVLDASDLAAALSDIETLYNAAKVCVKNNKKELKKVTELLEKTKEDASLLKQDASYIFLQKEQVNKKYEITQCTLLMYKTYETKKIVQHELGTERDSTLFNKEAPIWVKIHESKLFNIDLDLDVFYRFSGVEELQQKHSFFWVGVVFIMALVLMYLASWLWSVMMSKQKKASLLHGLTRYIPYFVFLSLMFFFFRQTFSGVYPRPLLALVFRYGLIFVVALALCSAVIAFFLKYKKISSVMARALQWRVVVFLGIGLLGLFSTLIFRGQDLGSAVGLLKESIILMLLSLIFLSSFWVVFSSSTVKERLSKRVTWFIKTCLFLVTIITIVAVCLGYYEFAMFFFPNILMTIVLLVVIKRLSILLGKAYTAVADPDRPLAYKLYQWTGIPPKNKLVELYVIRLLFNLALILWGIALLMIIWDVPQYYLLKTKDFFTADIKIFDVHVNIQHILRGLFAFCFIMLIGRALAGLTSMKSRSSDQKKYVRVTLVTMIHYASFVIGVFAALLIAGVNLSGFAIVAGALSVGMGFGLQSIASDFVSGLILIVNRPVKPGDHVVIDGEEGFIQKISILSTTLKTFEKSSMIIPNSNLVSKSVKNYTYRDKLSRITCTVILKNMIDIRRGQKALLEIASTHPEVLQDKLNQPKVLFSLDPALTLKLWCFINDVNRKHIVLSELNQEIVKVFKKRDIEISV